MHRNNVAPFPLHTAVNISNSMATRSRTALFLQYRQSYLASRGTSTFNQIAGSLDDVYMSEHVGLMAKDKRNIDGEYVVCVHVYIYVCVWCHEGCHDTQTIEGPASSNHVVPRTYLKSVQQQP